MRSLFRVVGVVLVAAMFTLAAALTAQPPAAQHAVPVDHASCRYAVQDESYGRVWQIARSVTGSNSMVTWLALELGPELAERPVTEVLPYLMDLREQVIERHPDHEDLVTAIITSTLVCDGEAVLGTLSEAEEYIREMSPSETVCPNRGMLLDRETLEIFRIEDIC